MKKKSLLYVNLLESTTCTSGKSGATNYTTQHIWYSSKSTRYVFVNTDITVLKLGSAQSTRILRLIDSALVPHRPHYVTPSVILNRGFNPFIILLTTVTSFESVIDPLFFSFSITKGNSFFSSDVIASSFDLVAVLNF